MKISTMIVMTALILAACGQAQTEYDPIAYENQVLQWRDERLRRLKMPTGYLNQVGLFWLEPGSHDFGSAADNDIRLPDTAAAFAGVFEVNEDGVWMTVEEGVDVRRKGDLVQRVLIADDTTETPVQITHNTLSWSVVKRDDRFAVRLRDFDHPFVTDFGPLPYFPIDASLRLHATLRRYDQPRIADVETVIEGLGYHPESPGIVEFAIDGESYGLEAYLSGDRLFFVFGDATNRDDTYGAGRFLYAELPGKDGRTIMDFNLAYSPPCAFNDFSTCPVASPRNRLPIRIEAGEKYDSTLHYSADARR